MEPLGPACPLLGTGSLELPLEAQRECWGPEPTLLRLLRSLPCSLPMLTKELELGQALPVGTAQPGAFLGHGVARSLAVGRKEPVSATCGHTMGCPRPEHFHRQQSVSLSPHWGQKPRAAQGEGEGGGGGREGGGSERKHTIIVPTLRT